MDGRPVNVRIAGQSYKVVSSASEDELQRLADTISERVEALQPGAKDPKSASQQAVLLAAMALAHELEVERAKRISVEQRTREILQRVLGHIDEALESET